MLRGMETLPITRLARSIQRALRHVGHEEGDPCPSCGHADAARPADWIDRALIRLGREPREPSCPWEAAAMADICGCPHPSHSR